MCISIVQELSTTTLPNNSLWSQITNMFKGNCTSSPYHHQHVLGDKIVVRTGMLEGSKQWGKPMLEIFGKDKLSWQPQTADNIAPGPPGS